jgi:hypothetical protein
VANSVAALPSVQLIFIFATYKMASGVSELTVSKVVL